MSGPGERPPPDGAAAAVAGAAESARLARRDSPRQRLLRLAFLVLLAGGLIVWAQLRRPRPLGLELDLSGVLPGEISELDLTVMREGRLLSRLERRYPGGTAPDTLRTEVRATPGPADVEATLIYPGRPARRTRIQVQLSEAVPARVVAQ